VRFGASMGDEAMQRLLVADSARLEIVPCLPNQRGGFNKGHPMEGWLATTAPVDLLRFCEAHALTCTVELASNGSTGEAIYRLGELVSVRCDAGAERAVTKMLEWNEGTFRFVLPTVDLPRGEGSMPPQAEETFAKPLAEEQRRAEEAESKCVEAIMVESVVEAPPEAAPPPARSLSGVVVERAEASRRDAEAKRRAEEKRARRAKRWAEEKRRADETDARRKVAAAPPQPVAQFSPDRPTMVVRLRRVMVEETFVTVPITEGLMKNGSSSGVDPEELLAQASRLVQGAAWHPERAPAVELHPEQPAKHAQRPPK
jgi:hypothetical protein